MYCKVYANNGYKRWFFKRTKKQHLKAVDTECVPHGYIINEYKHGFGVFTSTFDFVKSSGQVRENNHQFIPTFCHDNIPYLDEDVVFLGNVYPHFGHFLLEHMNRSYVFMDEKYKNMKFVLINNRGIDTVPNYIFNLLGVLGIKRENILILNQNMQFRNVYVPEQAFNLPIFSSNSFGKTFDYMAEHIKPANYEKIYVSRCKLGARRTYGEAKIQHIFENNGYTVIYPETLSLSEQIAYVKNCKYLAGCAGTALHLALFMPAGGTVIQLKRNSINKDNAPTQLLINKTKQLNSVFISCSTEKIKTDHGSKAPQIIGITKYLKDFFDDNNFTYMNTDISFDDDEYNQYMMALNAYKSEFGNSTIVRIKKAFIKYSSCLILGRENRANYRRFCKNKLHV